MKKLFISYCTEFEKSWGNRPDGFMLAVDQEAMRREITVQHKKGSPEYYWRYTEPKEIYCEDNTYIKKIEPRISESNNVAYFRDYENIDIELYKRI